MKGVIKMALVNKLKADAILAMKSGDKESLSTLRLLIAKLEKEKVAHKLTEVTDLSDEQVQTVITRNIKELNKEIEAYQEVGRDTTKQESEKELLLSFMPKQLTVGEITTQIEIAKEKVANGEIKNEMQYLSKELKGKADMKLVSTLLKSSK
jgi:uncharacterized protein